MAQVPNTVDRLSKLALQSHVNRTFVHGMLCNLSVPLANKDKKRQEARQSTPRGSCRCQPLSIPFYQQAICK